MPSTQLAESSASSHAASTALFPSVMSFQPADCASTNEVASTPAPEVDGPTCHHPTHQAAMAAVICHSQYVAIFLLFCTCSHLASCPSRRSPPQHWLLPNTPIHLTQLCQAHSMTASAPSASLRSYHVPASLVSLIPVSAASSKNANGSGFLAHVSVVAARQCPRPSCWPSPRLRPLPCHRCFPCTQHSSSMAPLPTYPWQHMGWTAYQCCCGFQSNSLAGKVGNVAHSSRGRSQVHCVGQQDVPPHGQKCNCASCWPSNYAGDTVSLP